MANLLQRSFQWVMQSVTQSTANAPQGSAGVALAIKTNTLNAPFESTKEDVDYIQGTITACLNARAQERGAIKFKVTQHGSANGMTAKMLQRVLDHPNPVQSRVDLLETCSHFHDTTGDAILYFVKGDGNLPAEVWCLPSFYCVALFDDPADPVPTGYRWADGRVILDTTALCFIRQNSVKTAPYTGSGMLSEMINTAMLYDFVTQGQKNWFLKGGAPNVALVQPQGSLLTSQQILDMQAMWANKYNGYNGTSNVAVLPDGVKPEHFGPAEMNFNASKEEIRDAIREFMQTPKIILGDTDNVNLNNGQTALAIFDRTIILRWAEKFCSALEHFFEQFGNNIKVELDPLFLRGMQQIQLAAAAPPGA